MLPRQKLSRSFGAAQSYSVLKTSYFIMVLGREKVEMFDECLLAACVRILSNFFRSHDCLAALKNDEYFTNIFDLNIQSSVIFKTALKNLDIIIYSLDIFA